MFKLLPSILLCLACFSVGFFGTAQAASGDWNVWSNEKLVINEMHGTAVHGHKFRVLTYKSSCQRKILWLSWSSYDKSVYELMRQDATFPILFA